jgi:formylglycine-generating enzyme required for sulfatase activity
MVLVPIPGGTFTMGPNGSPYADAQDGANHQVTVSPFYLGTTHVPWATFNTIYLWAQSHGYTFDNIGNYGAGYGYPPGGDVNQNPAVAVPWLSQLKWCNALSEHEGRTPVYYEDAAHTVVLRSSTSEITNGMVDWNANGYRLATEAEWEFAARAGSTASFWWGEATNDFSYEWSSENSEGKTWPVAGKRANTFGLFDMTGLVHTCTWDAFTYNYPSTTANNPHGPDEVGTNGGWRVMRGGGFLNPLTETVAYNARAYLGSRRGITFNIDNDFDGGMRVALNAP